MALSPLLSRAQDCPEVKNGYLALAPSVLLVSAISVFRGWFQGENNMFPTALSEVTEQVVKVGFGLLFAYLFRSDVEKAVTYILLSVSVSEACALALMAFLFRRVPEPFSGLKKGDRVSMKSVLRLSIPVTLSAALLPLSSLLDSVIIVRLLKRYTEDAVALYGLFSGGAVTIINLPVSVCYGIAAASVPAVSASSASEIVGGKNGARRRMVYALLVTLAVSVPCAAGLFLLASPAERVIFRALSADAREIGEGLFRQRGDALLYADALRLPYGHGKAEIRGAVHGNRGRCQDGLEFSARFPPADFRFRGGNRRGRLLFGCILARFDV